MIWLSLNLVFFTWELRWLEFSTAAWIKISRELQLGMRCQSCEKYGNSHAKYKTSSTGSSPKQQIKAGNHILCGSNKPLRSHLRWHLKIF